MDAIHHAVLFARWGVCRKSRPFRNATKASATNIVTNVSDAAEIHVTGSMWTGCKANSKAARAAVQYSKRRRNANQNTANTAPIWSTTAPRCHPQERNPNSVKLSIDQTTNKGR